MDRRLTHVFFDVTHTLLDVRGSVGEIYATHARAHGLPAPAEQVEAHFQAAIADLPQSLAPGLSAGEIRAREVAWWRELARRALAPFGPFPRFDAFFADVFEAFRGREAWVLRPDTASMLATLRAQGRRLGIISDMDSRIFDVLADFGLDATFDVVCLSFRCGFRKPDARLFAAALQEAGARAECSVHVGDSLRSDVQGALDAGLHAVHLDAKRSGGTPARAHVVHDLIQLPALLDRLDAEV